MARQSARGAHAICVRPAQVADLTRLAELYTQVFPAPGPRGRRPTSAAARPSEHETAWLRAGYERGIDSHEVRLVVAEIDGTIAGLLWAQDSPASVLSTDRLVLVEHVVVDPAHRRRGVGRALLSAAADFADERGAESVVALGRSGDREANRYLARLGFGPIATRRIAPVALLRRQLGQQPAVAVAGLPTGTGSSALRRRLRPRVPSALPRERA